LECQQSITFLVLVRSLNTQNFTLRAPKFSPAATFPLLPTSFSSWTGISCDPLNRIVDLRWGTTQFIQGYFPPELAQLTSLQVFGGPARSLYGTIPPAFWALPNLTTVALTRGGLTGYLPNTISASLKRVYVLSEGDFLFLCLRLFGLIVSLLLW
jgi:hypothetical protein